MDQVDVLTPELKCTTKEENKVVAFMPQTGKNKGNQNAALKPGERGRIQWTQSLSGDDLVKALKHLGVQHLDDADARKELRKKSEDLFSAWLAEQE